MADTPSRHVHESAAEIALGVLPPDELRAAESHLRECDECRAEVESMTPVAARLLDLVPGTEPPLGFDRRVLAAVPADGRGMPSGGGRATGRARRRWTARRATALGVAAAIAVAFGVAGWMAGRGSDSHPRRAELVAEFTQQGRDVGRFEAYGHPAWLSVTLSGAVVSGPVTCEVVRADGTVSNMGSFDLRDGSGSWSAPDPGGMSGVTEARLVDRTGRVVAVARFA